jgi:hypothetical protein
MGANTSARWPIFCTPSSVFSDIGSRACPQDLGRGCGSHPQEVSLGCGGGGLARSIVFTYPTREDGGSHLEIYRRVRYEGVCGEKGAEAL